MRRFRVYRTYLQKVINLALGKRPAQIEQKINIDRNLLFSFITILFIIQRVITTKPSLNFGMLIKCAGSRYIEPIFKTYCYLLP